jgi:hypothetical protein
VSNRYSPPSVEPVGRPQLTIPGDIAQTTMAIIQARPAKNLARYVPDDALRRGANRDAQGVADTYVRDRALGDTAVYGCAIHAQDGGDLSYGEWNDAADLDLRSPYQGRTKPDAKAAEL